MGYVRFPVPEFDHEPLKDLPWEAPAYLSDADIAKVRDQQKAGDAGAPGAYPVMPSDDFSDKFAIRGDHRHAVMCVLPAGGGHVYGRSTAWANQRLLIVDSLDPAALNVIADWKTPRPMNTRLGPEDGISLEGGTYFAVPVHQFADHWIGNRTLIRNDWDESTRANGFAMLSASDEDLDDFHECNLYVEYD